MLKLSKDGKFLKRRIPFNYKDVDLRAIDKATIYAENFPEDLKLEQLSAIFSRIGPLKNISLSKKQSGDISCTKSFGFCFVEYADETSALEAVKSFHNCVPSELMGQKDLIPLRVMTKSQWKAYKSVVAEIKRDFAALNPETSFKQRDTTIEKESGKN